MPTKPLTMQQKQANDMKRTQREVVNMGREGMTINDPKASQSKAPLQATAGGSLQQPAQTMQQRISNRPVFRSAALATGSGVNGPAVRAFPGMMQPPTQQPPPGLFQDLEGASMGPVQTMQQGGGQYDAPTMFAQQAAAQAGPGQAAGAMAQPGVANIAAGAPFNPTAGMFGGGQQQPMTPAPIFQQQATGPQGPGNAPRQPPPGMFDDFLAGDDRFSTLPPNAGDLEDYYSQTTDPYGRDLTDLGVPTLPTDPVWSPAPDPADPAAGGPTTLEELIAKLMGMDTTEAKAAAEERAMAAISQAKADASAQLGTSGFLGSAVVPTLTADLERQGLRELGSELVDIDQAAADRAIAAGGLGLGLEEIAQRDRALAEVRELMERMFMDDGTVDDGTGGGDQSLLDNAGIGDFAEAMLNPTGVESPSAIPGFDDGNAWPVPGTSGLYRGADGRFYQVGGAGAPPPQGNDTSGTDDYPDDAPNTTGSSPGGAAGGFLSTFGPGGSYWDLFNQRRA